MQVELRVRDTDLADALQGYVQRRLDSAMGRFDDQVGRVEVKLSRQPGSPAFTRHSCRISAELKPFGKIVATETGPDSYAAIDRAAARIGSLLIQRLEKMWEVEVWNTSVAAGWR